MFFYGIWENIDWWKVIVAVLFFGYASISLSLQLSKRSKMERVLCEAQKRNYLWHSVLKNILFSLLFWLGISFLWAFLFVRYDLSVSDAALVILGFVFLFFSECLAVFGIDPGDIPVI